MTEENNNEGESTPTNNVTDFNKFKEDKNKKPEGTWPKFGSQTGPITVGSEPPSPERRYILTLEDGEIEITGQVGFTQAFLLVGDVEGRVKFAANTSSWKYVTDCTDQEDTVIAELIEDDEED